MQRWPYKVPTIGSNSFGALRISPRTILPNVLHKGRDISQGEKARKTEKRAKKAEKAAKMDEKIVAVFFDVLLYFRTTINTQSMIKAINYMAVLKDTKTST